MDFLSHLWKVKFFHLFIPLFFIVSSLVIYLKIKKISNIEKMGIKVSGKSNEYNTVYLGVKNGKFIVLKEDEVICQEK